MRPDIGMLMIIWWREEREREKEKEREESVRRKEERANPRLLLNLLYRVQGEHPLSACCCNEGQNEPVHGGDESDSYG